ncbi:MAG: CAP domain-containing protein [Patulibacter sp.]
MPARRTARRTLLATAIAVGVVIGGTASAEAAQTRDEAVAGRAQVAADASVPAGWTGAFETCSVGSESAASQEATRRTLNLLRSWAGLGPVTWDPALNERALAAAMLMGANGQLSHGPPPSWRCWSQQASDGASTSNLYLGLSGAAAIVGYLDDAGIPSLGHRRWVLDAGAVTMGTGSTGTTNALTVIGNQQQTIAPLTTAAWPPAGWLPSEWVPGRWSVQLNGDPNQPPIDTTGATVSMTIDGQPVSVSDVADLGGGFGAGHTLAWTPALPDLASADHTVAVTIDGLEGGGYGSPAASYVVNTVTAPPAPPRPGVVPRPGTIWGPPFDTTPDDEPTDTGTLKGTQPPPARKRLRVTVRVLRRRVTLKITGPSTRGLRCALQRRGDPRRPYRACPSGTVFRQLRRGSWTVRVKDPQGRKARRTFGIR